MGTRNLTCVVVDGKMQVAQYGQWDGYLSYTGVGILTWLSDPKVDFARLKAAAVKATRMEQDSELDAWTELEPDFGKVQLIPHTDLDKYPSFTRDMGFGVLEYLVSTEQPIVVMDEGFAEDSLFCEWAYVIDLDKMTFEVFEGFNNTQLDKGERFYTDKIPTPDYLGANVYYPIKLVKSYDLNNLPTKEEFLAELEPPEEE